MSIEFKVDNDMKELLRTTVASDLTVANAATLELATALELPLKGAVIPGDIVSFIFEMPEFEPGQHVEYPIDFITSTNQKDFIAYTVPGTGKIPQMQIEGDYISVRTFDVATSLDWPRKYARDARWDIVQRAFQVMEGNIVKKRNNDGYHTLITAANNRGLSIYDDAATAGLFTKRVVSLAEVFLRRNAGGNSTSVRRGRLTHMCLSPEGMADIRSWDLTQVDDVTRREIFLSGGDQPMSKIFGVVLVDIDEFGVGQEYQKYYTNVLGQTVPGSKLEIGLALDLANKDSFIMPWRMQPNGSLIELLPDPTLIRENRTGYFGRLEYGVAAFDPRRILLFSF